MNVSFSSLISLSITMIVIFGTCNEKFRLSIFVDEMQYEELSRFLIKESYIVMMHRCVCVLKILNVMFDNN